MTALMNEKPSFSDAFIAVLHVTLLFLPSGSEDAFSDNIYQLSALKGYEQKNDQNT